MADPIFGPLSIDDFVGVIGKNYISPHLISIGTGEYKFLQYRRAVLLIPQTPTTVGTSYIYPGSAPVNDASSIPIPAGVNIYLDARGDWYVKTGSAGTEKFLVIDAGGAANAQAVASLLGGSGGGATPVANRGAWVSVQKNVTTAGTPVNCSSQAVPNGFSVTVKAKTTNTGRIGVGTSSANANISTGAPHLLGPGESLRLYITNHNLIWLDSVVNGEGACLANET